MTIREQIAAWPERPRTPEVPDELVWHEYWIRRTDSADKRLATATEALRAAVQWARPMKDAPADARPAWFADARAVLDALDKEGK